MTSRLAVWWDGRIAGGGMLPLTAGAGAAKTRVSLPICVEIVTISAFPGSAAI